MLKLTLCLCASLMFGLSATALASDGSSKIAADAEGYTAHLERMLRKPVRSGFFQDDDLNDLRENEHFADLEQLADSGDPDALYRTGRVYMDPKTQPFDTERATDLLHRAAQAGISAALAALGEIYASQKDRDGALERAEKCLLAATEADNPRGMYVYGSMLLKGELPLDRTLSEGERTILGMGLLERAASAGSADAQYLLGYLHSAGEVTERDTRTALDMFFKAAVQNHSDALSSLGYMYALGTEVSSNHDLAYRLFRRACALGGAEGCKMKSRFERAHAGVSVLLGEGSRGGALKK